MVQVSFEREENIPGKVKVLVTRSFSFFLTMFSKVFCCSFFSFFRDIYDTFIYMM